MPGTGCGKRKNTPIVSKKKVLKKKPKFKKLPRVAGRTV